MSLAALKVGIATDYLLGIYATPHLPEIKTHERA